MTRLALLALLWLVPALAGAQPYAVPSQSAHAMNSEVVSAAATANVFTFAGVASTRVRLASIKAFCSAGTATITVTDGGTTVWTSATGFVDTTTKTVTWKPPLTGGYGAAVVVTVSSCGGGNTSTVAVQADRD